MKEMRNAEVEPDRDSGSRAVKISFDTLENLDYRLRWVIGGLGLGTAERNELEEMEEILWDILNPRGGRWPFKFVRMSLWTLERIRGRLDQVMKRDLRGFKRGERDVPEWIHEKIRSLQERAVEMEGHDPYNPKPFITNPMERIEKPKEVQMPYVELEKMQEQIGFAMVRLGCGSPERQSLNQAYGVLRDLLHLERCPHAERSARLVTVPLDTMERIERWLDSGDNIRFARESMKLEQARAKIQELLYHASVPQGEKKNG